MQLSIVQCVKSIAKTYFDRGSIIGVVKAGLKEATNKKLAINTNNLIVEELMNELHWNLLIKEAKSFNDKELVSQ